MNMQDIKIVVGIPAFNEGENIEDIVNKAKKYATKVIVCDDGSTDDTYERAKAAGAYVIRHATNKGYGAAIRTLFYAAKESNADILVTLDADGQHDPDYIPRVIEPIMSKGFDIVIGSRFINQNGKVPLYRRFGIKLITKLMHSVAYNSITDAQSGFRAYSKNAISKIDLRKAGMDVSTEILFRAKEENLTINEVPITIRYDVENPSTHNPILHGFELITSIILFISLRRPLLFYGLPGIVFLLISGYFMLSALQLFSETRFVSTNQIIISMGSAIIGVVLLITGIILSSIIALFKYKKFNY